jgi:hypothetical protein
MKTVAKIALLFSMALTLAACGGGGGVEPGYRAIKTIQRSDEEVAKLMSVNDNLIVPGERVGPVFLGMTEGSLYQKMGNPNHSDMMDRGATKYYQWRDIRVEVKESDHKVFNIEVTGSSYRTAEGISTGSSDLEVKSKLGQPHWEVPFNTPQSTSKLCFNSGITILVKSGRVTSIFLFTSGTCE